MLPDLIDAMNIELLPISARHVLVAVEPEPLTRDPFDRLLLAQCQIEDLRLITLDRAIVSHRLAAK
jgi:PIN domain nuclease of toxin-antitoxin system